MFQRSITQGLLFLLSFTLFSLPQVKADEKLKLNEKIADFSAQVERDPELAIKLGKPLLSTTDREPELNYEIHIGLSRAHLMLGETSGAIMHAKLASQAAVFLGDIEKQAQAHNNLGNGHYYRANYSQALESHQHALSLRESLKLTQKTADSQNNIALVYMQMGQPDKALQLYKEAHAKYLSLNSKYDQADVLSNIGNVLYHLGQLPQAKQYYEDALDLFEEVNVNNGIAGTLGNLGIVHKEMGETERAIELYQQALVLNRELKANYFIAANLNNLASLYNKLERFELAERYAEEAMLLCREKQLNSILANSLHSYAQALAGLGKLNQSLTYGLESASVASSAQDQLQRINSLEFISSVYEKLGEYEKSLTYFQQFKKENDELAKQQFTREISDSKQALDLVVRDNKIALLEQEKHLLSLEEQKTTNAFYFKTTLLVFLFALVSIYFYMRKKRQTERDLNKVLAQKEQLKVSQQVFFEQLDNSLNVLSQRVHQHETAPSLSDCEQVEQQTSQIIEFTQSVERFKDILWFSHGLPNLTLKRQQLAAIVDECFLVITEVENNPNLLLSNQVQKVGLFVFADKELLTKTIGYLLKRAVLVAGDEEICVSSDIVGQFIKISIRDKSRGCDEGRLKQILSCSDAKLITGDLESELLFVAKSLIQIQGGRITATANPSHGCIISFTLPK